jgi:gliding motility-associated-like protein
VSKGGGLYGFFHFVMHYLAFLLICCLLPFLSFAQPGMLQTNCPRSQKQASLWYFGERAGIDFRSGEAIPLKDKDTMTSLKSSAVMCDSLGNLMLFTDGKRVWNRSFSLMRNASSLVGSTGATQSALVVPVPLISTKYYLFTNDVLNYNPDNTFLTNGLTYTIIDMTMWGNTGDARDTMNFTLLKPACQKLSAVRHKNGIDYWVVAHEWNSAKFHAYHIASGGISENVVSDIGTYTGGGIADQNNAAGYMKISPDGSKIALAISGMNRVELYNFDNATGIISNPLVFDTPDEGISPYGIEFSSDNSKLYVSLLQLTGSGPPVSPSRIYQFDITKGLTDPILISSNKGVRSGGMQLAPDGRIYVARTINYQDKKDSLDVIYNPTRPGLECNFNYLNSIANCRFPLAGRKSIYGLPSFIQSYFNIPLFTYDSICNQDSVRFTIVNKANIDSVLWDFGDGTISRILDAAHPYLVPGNYEVKLKEFFHGKSYLSTSMVPVLAVPRTILEEQALLYPQASVNLHAGGGFLNYYWSTGSTDSIINVVREGYYTVRVKNNNCCFNTDTVYVESFMYYAPNAFTPDGDGRNDLFRLIGMDTNVKIDLKIYNRTGFIVFTSDNIEQGWDGTWKGDPQPLGTYMWIAHIRFLDPDVITGGEIILKGNVLLLR